MDGCLLGPNYASVTIYVGKAAHPFSQLFLQLKLLLLAGQIPSHLLCPYKYNFPSAKDQVGVTWAKYATHANQDIILPLQHQLSANLSVLLRPYRYNYNRTR